MTTETETTCQVHRWDEIFGDRYCHDCGAELVLTCRGCRNGLQSADKFCGKCGTAAPERSA